MNRPLIGTVLVVALAAIGIWTMRANDARNVAQTSSRGEVARNAPIDMPRATPASSASRPDKPVALLWKAPETREMAHLRSHKDMATLYGQVEHATTAESLYIKAAIYARCAKRGDDGLASTGSAAERREKLLASIPPNAPHVARRMKAFDSLGSDACGGLELGPYRDEEFKRMLAAAADAGDLRAQALMLAQSIEQPGVTRPQGYAYGEAELATMRTLLASGDPDVIRSLQGVLSSTLRSGVMTLNGEPVDPRSMHAAYTLLRCDLGAPCGASAPQLLSHCAYMGRCDAGSMYEYIYHYDHSPGQGVLIDRYRQMLASMMNARDFSQLTISPTRGPPQSSFTFGGFERP
ncbi:MAG TPA: hypothetical protein VNE58_00565 [Casimicrobiaceae bacterium]|nr:hypothetical protein [Casimicrobiaceae bacterium]